MSTRTFRSYNCAYIPMPQARNPIFSWARQATQTNEHVPSSLALSLPSPSPALTMSRSSVYTSSHALVPILSPVPVPRHRVEYTGHHRSTQCRKLTRMFTTLFVAFAMVTFTMLIVSILTILWSLSIITLP